jgi:hypothetical protein
MRFDFRNTTLHIILALLLGFGAGLAYSWLISPVTYVDASPAILRVDFKDQYRSVIAASYASTHDLPRARARLELLGDVDSIAELSAQAQRMLASGEPFESVRPLAQLATDLQQGFASVEVKNVPSPAQPTNTITVETPFVETPFVEETLPLTQTFVFEAEPTLPFEQTLVIPQGPLSTSTPRPTSPPNPSTADPFTLVGQDTVCDTSIEEGLLQVILMDSRRRQVPGIEIIVTWNQGEDHFFTGLKPELGNGYADFIMKAETVYSIRVVEGGSFVPNITAPGCTDANGASYMGGLLLTFQQP